MQVRVTGGEIDQQELAAYQRRAEAKYPHEALEALDIHVEGDFVDLVYHLYPQSFSRIRRITGYLVGDMSRWNNGKRAEEQERVKHM